MFNHVVVLGLDGLTYEILLKFVNNGILPGFSKILENGVIARLRSTIPPLSPPAWISIFTGVDPSKHSVLGFVKIQKSNNDFKLRPISSRDIKAKRVWDLLSLIGKRNVVFQAPFEYPIHKINGILSSGLGTPSLEVSPVYPSKYLKTFLHIAPQYDVSYGEELIKEDWKKFLIKFFTTVNSEIKIANYLFNNERWHSYFAIFRGIDIMQHFFYNDEEILRHIYMLYDRFILKIFKNLPQKSLLIVCSDHGFSSFDTVFYVNAWLSEIELLSIKSHSKVRLPIYIPTTHNRYQLPKVIYRLLYTLLKKSKSNPQLLDFSTKLMRILNIDVDIKGSIGYLWNIDWNNTRSYFSVATQGIHIVANSKEEYEDVRHLIKKEITKVRAPDGRPVIRNVYFKEEIYSNPNNQLVPDVLLTKNEGFRLACDIPASNEDYFAPSIFERGEHCELNGVLILASKSDQINLIDNEPSVTDITPTILSAYGISTPKYMDGSSLIRGGKVKYIKLFDLLAPR